MLVDLSDQVCVSMTSVRELYNVMLEMNVYCCFLYIYYIYSMLVITAYMCYIYSMLVITAYVCYIYSMLVITAYVCYIYSMLVITAYVCSNHFSTFILTSVYKLKK